MRSRRARDRRGLLGEAGNTSRRKVMVGGAGMKRFDEARVRAGRRTNRGHCRRVIRTNFGARMAKIFRENSDSLV